MPRMLQKDLSSAVGPSHNRHFTRGQGVTPACLLLPFEPLFLPFLLPGAPSLCFLHKAAIIEHVTHNCITSPCQELRRPSIIATALKKETLSFITEETMRGKERCLHWSRLYSQLGSGQDPCTVLPHRPVLLQACAAPHILLVCLWHQDRVGMALAECPQQNVKMAARFETLTHRFPNQRLLPPLPA